MTYNPDHMWVDEAQLIDTPKITFTGDAIKIITRKSNPDEPFEKEFNFREWFKAQHAALEREYFREKLLERVIENPVGAMELPKSAMNSVYSDYADLLQDFKVIATHTNTVFTIEDFDIRYVSWKLSWRPRKESDGR